MNSNKNKIRAAIGTLLVHLAIFTFLYLFYIRKPQMQEEGGVPVMLGNSELSQGLFDPATMTEVDVMPENTAFPDEFIPQETEPKIITQSEEPSMNISPQKVEAKKPKKEKMKKESPKTREKTESEKKAEIEKRVAKVADSKIAGAFGKGSKMGDSGSGSSGSETEGSLTGNSSTGKMTGTGGYGTFDLNGRSIGEGGLPRPVYNVQDEGRVVVTITVNPAGTVIGTSINKRTNTVNVALRKAAEDAAKRARFNSVEGVNNQTGTITYYFKLK